MTAKIKPSLVAAVLLAAAASAFFQQRQIIHLRQQVDAATVHAASAVTKPTLNQLETSLQKILAEPNHDKRKMASDNFAKTLDPAQAHALLDYLNKLPANNRIEGVEESLIPIWAKDDPATVLAWVQNHLQKPIAPVVYIDLLRSYPKSGMIGAYRTICLPLMRNGSC